MLAQGTLQSVIQQSLREPRSIERDLAFFLGLMQISLRYLSNSLSEVVDSLLGLLRGESAILSSWRVA